MQILKKLLGFNLFRPDVSCRTYIIKISFFTFINNVKNNDIGVDGA